ncbi:MAG: HlyD family secretion protein [Xanthomonadales bacterium]|nr:HlyD family secretion protein [Xanthomonadales bacterium]
MTSDKKRDPVRLWTFIVLALCIVLMTVYLVGDRLTPFTTQARVHAYVVPVAPQVAGRLISVDVENNQMVKEGQKLFSIDPGSYELAVQAAEAALKNTEQSTRSGISNVEASRANVDSAKASVWAAEQDTTRMRRIRKEDEGAISERRIQQSEASLESSRAKLVAAQASLQAAISALGSTDENNAQIQQARSNLENARLNLERTVVNAPRDGMITDLRVDQGNYAASGAALMTFIAIHDTWIQADLSENNLGHVDAGDRVEVTFDVRPGKVFKGRVRQMGYGVEVNANALGTLPTIDNDRNWLRAEQRFPVTIDFEASDLSESNLRVGSQASVMVYTGDNPIMNALGRFYIRVNAYLSYAY